MAVVVTKEIKKKRILVLVFSALVLATFSILYFGFFRKSSPPPPQIKDSGMASVIGTTVSEQVSDLKVKILEDIRFQGLQPPPGVPINTQTTGKSNPFSD
ncbi:MAG: hypothetical protein AAB394_01090 [Patescibacteria group bacterium]